MSPDEVTVVVPTFNERENISDITSAITAHGYRILIVDDGSPDGTGAIADEMSTTNSSVSVLHRSEKLGLGPAYAAGFDRVLGGASQVVVEMDADFSHDPDDLPRLVAALENADLVIGSRYVAGGAAPDWPWLRRFISRSGNVYARAMLGIPVHDATAGFRAFRREALARLPYATAEASGYGFQVEMAWRAHEAGMRVVEVPITFRDRTKGNSKMGLRIVAEAMWLVTIWGLQRIFKSLRGRSE